MARVVGGKTKDAEVKKGPAAMGKVKNEAVEDFDPEGDVYDTQPAPPDDGQYLLLLRSPKKGDKFRNISWTDADDNSHDDFSVRYEAECVDTKSKAFGRRWFGDITTFTRKNPKTGKNSNQVASVLVKAGVKPTGKKETDKNTLLGLLAKGTIKLYGKSQWQAKLKWDEKADADYKARTRILFARGQAAFENGKGYAVPLSEVPEDTVITKKIKGEEVEYQFTEGEPLRTDAVITRFLSLEEGAEE